ncbi:MAG: xylulokinase [Pseudomonadota bacterium]
MFLGLDLGTSGLRALLIDDGQQTVGEATAPLDVTRPHDGWSEQDADSWIAAAELALSQLGASHDLSAVQGVGLSGQMHGATLLDETDKPLRPCILWNDTRSHAEAAEMDADPKWREISGNIVFPGFTAPKVEWVRRNEPEIFARVRRVLLPKDYLRLWLTGEAVSDMSDSAGTSWLDTGDRNWSDSLLQVSGLDRSQMPRLVEGSEVSGRVRAEIASRFGLKANVPVAGGAGDNAATAIGLGIARAGEGFVSLGTSGVLFAACDTYAPASETAVHTFCHALPETWHQMGVILAAADALTWLSRLTGKSSADLTAGLENLEAPGHALFLPYLGGERTPHNDADVRGSFLGLSHATDTEAATRAVLNGVAFAFKDCLDALSATGTRFDTLIAAGGGSASRVWIEAIATALQIRIEVPRVSSVGAAQGAARLGLMAATGAGPQVAARPEIAETIDPNETLIAAYAEGHERFKDAYKAVKEVS